jgi:hypothetical protein
VKWHQYIFSIKPVARTSRVFFSCVCGCYWLICRGFLLFQRPSVKQSLSTDTQYTHRLFYQQLASSVGREMMENCD